MKIAIAYFLNFIEYFFFTSLIVGRSAFNSKSISGDPVTNTLLLFCPLAELTSF